MNRKRKEGETYEEYRENLHIEAEQIKQRLEGRYLHVSKTFKVADGKVVGRNRGITYVKEDN